MAKLSEQTEKLKKKYKLITIFSWILTFVPVLVYMILAFINGGPMQKVTLGFTVTIAIVLVFANIIFKINLRSSIWILLLGIYVCMDKIMPLLLIIALTTILDELVLTPLAKKYKQKFVINKEIDSRE